MMKEYFDLLPLLHIAAVSPLRPYATKRTLDRMLNQPQAAKRAEKRGEALPSDLSPIAHLTELWL